MLKGLGTDLVQCSRIQKSVEKTPGFLDRVYTKSEQAYCGSRKNPYRCYAARFAAKEAFLKMCGVGIFRCPLTHIEVVKNSSGKSIFRLGEKAQALVDERGICQISLSLSHEGNMAIAVAIGEDEI